MELDLGQESSDFKERREVFLHEYQNLVDRYGCDFLSQPLYVPSGESNKWETVIDTRVMNVLAMPIKSPFEEYPKK